jgi:ketosteroid isomerase-like protein
MIKSVVALLLAVGIGGAASSAAFAGPDQSKPSHNIADKTHAYLAAFENKNLETVDAMTHPQVTVTVPMSFSGAPEPAARFVGKTQVLGYFQSVFTNMTRIDFVDVRTSVTADGRTSFVQANGDFTAADGRPYRNVYVFRLDWDGGRLVSVDEYANPMAYCVTFTPEAC